MRWGKPPLGWFKLNTDGASFGNRRKTGGGGLIRDSLGNWVKGFSRSIGYVLSIMAKFWALRDGQRLASDIGIQNLEVELDAKVIVDLVKSKINANRPYSPLLNDCKSLLGNFHQVRVKHVFQKANKCVDTLAKVGCSL